MEQTLSLSLSSLMRLRCYETSEAIPTLLEQLVEMFLQRHQTMLEAIRAALADRDQVAVEQAAHALKGTASNLCASEVVLSAGQLEAFGRLGTLVEGPMIYAQLEKAVLRLVQLLEKRSRKQTDSRKYAA